MCMAVSHSISFPKAQSGWPGFNTELASSRDVQAFGTPLLRPLLSGLLQVLTENLSLLFLVWGQFAFELALEFLGFIPLASLLLSSRIDSTADVAAPGTQCGHGLSRRWVQVASWLPCPAHGTPMAKGSAYSF